MTDLHRRKVTGLLASSGTLDGITAAVSRFYCGESVTLLPRGENCWAICNTHSGEETERTRIIRKARRFRFEMLEPDPETTLREMWTAEGVSQQRQDELIAQITAKAQPGAQVGPFTIGQPTPEAARPAYRVQLTRAGEQYMIPGTEPEDRPKSAQLSLF